MTFTPALRRFSVLLAFPLPLSAVRAQPALVPSLPLAEIPAELKTALGSVLAVVMIIAFIKGVIDVISGASKMRHGDPDGKMSLVAGALTAGAAMIMGAFFTIFGLGDGILRPSF